MYSYQIIDFEKPLERRDYPDPEPQGSEILVRITGCGVCHSDLHIWQGYFDLGDGNRITHADRRCTLPFTMGHEIIGEVKALGPEAAGVSVGDRRIVYPWIGCGECAVCKEGNENQCNKPRGPGTRRDGGYADHVVVPHARYLIDFEGIDEDLACTYACSGLTAYSALRKLDKLNDRDKVVIVGAGGVGLNAVHIGSTVLSQDLIVADLDSAKRDAALASGAKHAVDNDADDAVAQIKELTDGGAGGVIDFVGSPVTAQFGLDVLRKGGTLVIVGLFGGSITMPVPFFPFFQRRILGSYVGSLPEMHEIIDLVKGGTVPPIPIRTRPLSEINQAFDDMVAGDIVGRVVVKP